ncbi:MAG: hypothetical protein ACJ74O_02795 [Frankiaceae bacterium]
MSSGTLDWNKRLDSLTDEIALVREAGRNELGVEPLLARLSTLRGLGVVRHRVRVDTPLGAAQAIVGVVWEAVEQLPETQEGTYAKMLFGVHYKTSELPPAKARRATQEASGVQDRWFRMKVEPGLRRLVAQQILELDRAEDILGGARTMEVGGDVPHSVALYWLQLFRDHYFRMETTAYALQTDLMTALEQRASAMPSWRKYFRQAMFWNVEFSYLRQRFFDRHGPMWLTVAESAGEQMVDSAERIEYHDPYPDEYMGKLRVLYALLEHKEAYLFFDAVAGATGLDDFMVKAEFWLSLCRCDLQRPDERCDVHLVIRHCDLFGQAVEEDFDRIKQWYRTERHAADAHIRGLIEEFRTPGRERSYLAHEESE